MHTYRKWQEKGHNRVLSHYFLPVAFTAFGASYVTMKNTARKAAKRHLRTISTFMAALIRELAGGKRRSGNELKKRCELCGRTYDRQEKRQGKSCKKKRKGEARKQKTGEKTAV